MSNSSPIANWYFSEDESKHLKQIVVDLPNSSKIPSRVKNVVGGVRIMTVSLGGFASDALLISDESSNKAVPIIFINATNAIDMLPSYMTIQHVAFSFYKMNNGGVFQIFNHVEVPELERQFGSPFLVESSYWPEESETRELIEILIDNDELEVCFVAPGKNGPCTGYYGFKVILPEECKSQLKSEWKELLEYHNSVSSSKRNYRQALNQYNNENPLEENPILKNTSRKTTSTKQKSSSGGCYIATATFGSYDHPTVLIFREFRDNILTNSFLGKLFIKSYYRVSPSMSRLVSHSSILKNTSETFLTTLSIFIKKLLRYNQSAHRDL